MKVVLHMFYRLLMTCCLYLIKSPMKRANFMRRMNIFHAIGNRVMIMPRKIPLYAKLISIGNNVWIASGVEFVTHDVAHYMLNGIKIRENIKFIEKIGCINIGDNVFIGSDVKILYDVNVGNNVIIAAGSVVNKDIPDNSVVGGMPAKVIGNFNDFLKKRKDFKANNPADNTNMYISKECEEEQWKNFLDKRYKD